MGVIGSGHFGTAIAALAIKGGHRVVPSNSRDAASLTDLVAHLGPRATVATSSRTAEVGDIVVVTVPVRAFPDLPIAPLAGKTVIDICNYGVDRDGPIAELDSGTFTSRELLQRYLTDAVVVVVVVKACTTISFEHLRSLARPPGAADRPYLPIAGDSRRAKEIVTEFLGSTGYGVVDAGVLADSWRQSTRTPVWGAPYGPSAAARGRPAGEELIRAALANAQR